MMFIPLNMQPRLTNIIVTNYASYPLILEPCAEKLVSTAVKIQIPKIGM